MTISNADLMAGLNAKKDQIADKTIGGGGFEPPAKGPGFAVLIGYIEYGLGIQSEKNIKAYGVKKQGIQATLFFELIGKKWQDSYEDKDGNKVTFQKRIQVNIQIKGGERATYTKLMNAMRYGRKDLPSPAFMLGETFKVRVTHTTVGEGATARTYANLRDDSGFNIGRPVREIENPETGDIEERIIKAPKSDTPWMLFLWDTPDMNQWKSIYIDGTREIEVTEEVDGEKVKVQKTVSKNRHQEKCLAAPNFEGSPLQLMLAENQLEDALVDTPDEVEDAEEVAEGDELGDADLDEDFDDEIPF